MGFLGSVADGVLDRSAEELIGAIFVAAAVALVMAGLYWLGRRKAMESPSFVGALAFAAGVACMAVVLGHIEQTAASQVSGTGLFAPFPPKPTRGPINLAKQPLPPAFYGAGWSSGFHVVLAADEDHNGRLTRDEVDRLVQKADTDGDGSVDFRDIDRLIVGRVRWPSPPLGANFPEGRNRQVRAEGSSKTAARKSPHREASPRKADE
jgi:hypothetical protein